MHNFIIYKVLPICILSMTIIFTIFLGELVFEFAREVIFK